MLEATRHCVVDVQANINRYWDMRAEGYNAHHLRQVANREIHDAWLNVWRRVLPPPPARVLDAGTGTGHAALLLAELGYDVVGIDLSAGMLEQARTKAEGMDRTPAFMLGDAVNPRFEPGSFDAVTARYLLWTLRTPDVALRNWRELVRPGGTVAVIDSTWFSGGVPSSSDEGTGLPGFTTLYHEDVLAALPLVESETIEDTAQIVRGSGFDAVTVHPLYEVLDMDRRFGVADGHEVQLQFAITGRRRTGPAG